MSTLKANNNTKCIRCAKIIFENQNSIGCDDCEGWLHLRCSGFKLKQFKQICSNKDSTFTCRYCKFYKCGKCSKPVYPPQNGIQCDVNECEKWYHLRCTKFTLAEYLNSKSRLHTDMWYCPDCANLPFMDLNPKEFTELVKDDLKLKQYYTTIPSIDTFKTRCSVCKRNITKNQKPKSLPCTDCHTFIHRKCSNISLPELLDSKASHLKNWSCNTCMSQRFPFQEIDTIDVLKLTYNSLVYSPCL